MNIELSLKIPLVNILDSSIKKILKISTQLLLSPFYAVESDILSSFNAVDDKHLPSLRKSLFNHSLSVYRLTKFLELNGMLSSEDLFLLRRDFVICLATHDLSKSVLKDLGTNLSRSKRLGDFSVATTSKGDSGIILRILNDSQNCIDEMKDLIKDLELSSILPATFVKGRYNPRTKQSSRLWWHTELPFNVSDGYASSKFKSNGSKYKAGSFNIKDYKSNYSKTLFDFYRSN